MNEIYNSKTCKKEMAGRIMTAREAAGLTRQQVADAIGKRMDGTFSVDVLKQWEYGTNRVRVDLIPLLCEILHVDTGYLFGESIRSSPDSFVMCRVSLDFQRTLQKSSLDIDTTTAMTNGPMKYRRMPCFFPKRQRR